MASLLGIEDNSLYFHRASESLAGAESSRESFVVVSGSLTGIEGGVVAVVHVGHGHHLC